VCLTVHVSMCLCISSLCLFVTFHLEIATDKKFNQIVQNHFPKKNRLKSNILAPGDYYWRISSLDKNKLEGRSSEIRELHITRNLELNIIPSTPPIDDLNNWIIGPTNTIKVAAKLYDTSVTNLEYSLNSGEYFETDGRIFFHSEGEYLLTVRGVGADGIKGEPLQQHIIVDTSPPTIDYQVSPIQRDSEIGDFVYVTLDVTDNTGVESVVYSINDKEFKPYTGRFKLAVNKQYKNIHKQAADIFGKDVVDAHLRCH